MARGWRIITVLHSLNARLYVYVPFELENPVMVLLYDSKSFIHDCERLVRSLLMIVEGTYQGQGTIARVAKRLAPP